MVTRMKLDNLMNYIITCCVDREDLQPYINNECMSVPKYLHSAHLTDLEVDVDKLAEYIGYSSASAVGYQTALSDMQHRLDQLKRGHTPASVDDE